MDRPGGRITPVPGLAGVVISASIMPIYHDPTESRKRSRLPDTVIRRSTSLPGLEHLTGADLLITTEQSPADLRTLKDEPWLSSILTLAWQGYEAKDVARMTEQPMPIVLTVLKFQNACECGLLVQRKSGRDLASSVPRLSEILFKMLAWTDKPWLLFVGTLQSDSRSRALIDGQDTGFDFNAVQGALEAWQMRGGYVTFLSRDGQVAPWVSRWLNKLKGLSKEKLLAARKPPQTMLGLGNEKAWMTTLTTFPGIGSDKARLIGDHCGSLAGSIGFLSDLNSVGEIKGVGPRTIQDSRQWLGLTEPWLRMSVEVTLESEEKQ